MEEIQDSRIKESRHSVKDEQIIYHQKVLHLDSCHPDSKTKKIFKTK